MSMTALLFAAATALMVMGLALLVFQLVSRRAATDVSSRLSPVGDIHSHDAELDSPWVSLLATPGRGMERWLQDDEESISLLLTRAGWRDARMRSLFYVLQVALPLFGVAVSLLIGFASEKLGGLEIFLLVFAAFAVAVLLPRYLLRWAARRRQARVRTEVPLFVHMMVMLFDAGLSTRQALHSLVRDGKDVLPELNREIRLVLRQLDAGADLTQVLGDMDADLAVSELSNVLGLLRQVERYGGEIRESLLTALSVIEERRTLSMRERVNKMAGKMTVVMVGFFFPALLLCVAGPAFTAIIFALRSATS